MVNGPEEPSVDCVTATAAIGKLSAISVAAVAKSWTTSLKRLRIGVAALTVLAVLILQSDDPLLQSQPFGMDIAAEVVLQ